MADGTVTNAVVQLFWSEPAREVEYWLSKSSGWVAGRHAFLAVNGQGTGGEA